MRTRRITNRIMYTERDSGDVPFLSPIMIGPAMSFAVIDVAERFAQLVIETVLDARTTRGTDVAGYVAGIEIGRRVDASVGSPKGIPRVFGTVTATSDNAVFFEYKWHIFTTALTRLHGRAA